MISEQFQMNNGPSILEMLLGALFTELKIPLYNNCIIHMTATTVHRIREKNATQLGNYYIIMSYNGFRKYCCSL